MTAIDSKEMSQGVYTHGWIFLTRNIVFVCVDISKKQTVQIYIDTFFFYIVYNVLFLTGNWSARLRFHFSE